MTDSRKNRPASNVPPTKEDEETKSPHPTGGYYYDDSTGYEIYDELDESDEQDNSVTNNRSSCSR